MIGLLFLDREAKKVHIYNKTLLQTTYSSIANKDQLNY